MNIRDEITLFYNDLCEYRYSIEGKTLAKCFKNAHNTKALENAINDYYSKRNASPCGLTYASEQDKALGIKIDKKASEYLISLY